MLAEHASAELEIEPEGAERWNAASFAQGLDGLGGSACLQACLTSGLFGGQTLAAEVFFGQFQVQLEFLLEAGVAAAAAEEARDA
jgi:hypothetical protein